MIIDSSIAYLNLEATIRKRGYSMTTTTLLRESLRRGALALFLGADLPQTVTGLPSRADLPRGLAQPAHVVKVSGKRGL